jgi:hypothetical protein
MENGKQPAFAVSKEMCEASEIETYPYGLTKREYFAAKALQGLMVQAIAGQHNSNTKQWNDERAKFAVDMADAVLSALAKQTDV